MPVGAKTSIIALISALIIVALYVASSWFLLQHFVLTQSLPDLSWSRAMVIYNGIASAGFAAIGVLLGTSVQQVNLAAAQTGLAKAQTDSDNKTQAIKTALNKLNGAVVNTPADLGGGPVREETRVAETVRILMDAV
jgi:hypothetical protein